MENKYFTPDIEDLYVGYKLEIKGKHDTNWQPVVLGKDAIWHKFTNLENLGQVMEQLRVPYLTKEQIEAEGWEYEKEIKTVQCYDKENIFIAYSEKTHRMLIRKHNNETWKTIYFGRCKDINAFRKIIKLLEI